MTHIPPVAPPVLSQFLPATEEEVRIAILSASDASCSLDVIPTNFFKSCLHVLLKPITNIVNLCLIEGCFPSQYKHAIVSPLIKKWNLPKDELNSYRPISHLNFISKIVERIVHSRLSMHLNSFSSMSKFQSAYRPLHSTESALLKIQNDLLLATEQRKVSALVLLDLSAAFDTIDHKILVSRLNTYFGLTDCALSFMISYLQDRSQSVCIGDTKSESTPVCTGVPQGSVLGPLLFSMYTTPLTNVLSSAGVSFHFYADDTQIYLSFPPNDSILNLLQLSGILDTVHSWLTSNRLVVNPSKTEYILIGTGQQRSKLSDPSIVFHHNKLSPVDALRNLGVVFDPDLSHKKHVTKICQTSFLYIRQLRQIREYLDLNSSKTLANALVISRLDYCNSLLFGLPNSTLHRLQLIQNSLARATVPQTKRYDHITPILKQLHWLPVLKRIEYKIAMTTFNVLTNKQPVYLAELLVPVKNSARRSSNKNLLVAPLIKSANGRRSFSFAAPTVWNSLPQHIRDCKTTATFKKCLKTFLFPP